MISAAMLFRIIAFAAILFIGLPLTANAERPRTINWPDLLPPVPVLEDPLENVSMTARYDLGYAAKVLGDAQRGTISRDSAEYKNALQLLERLKTQGIDIDRLVTAVAERDAELMRRKSAMREELNGSMVRIPGYALPLEMSGASTTEMLLVPYVGACIHVPAPPPNQIVHVTPSEPIELEGLYQAVWITGRIQIEQGNRALSFVDGQADIVTGYTIQAARVEPYK